MLCHCLFWSEEEQLNFLAGVHDYIKDKTYLFEVLDGKNKEKTHIVFEGEWKYYITTNLQTGQYLMSMFK